MSEPALAPTASLQARALPMRGRRNQLNSLEALERGFALFRSTFVREAWRYYAGSAPLVFCFIPMWVVNGQIRLSDGVVLMEAALLSAAYLLRVCMVASYMQRVRRRAFGTRAPRRMLDLAVETALVGATVALELGDEFGLVTYADGAKSWLRAGSGQSQFHRFRDCLLHIEPLPTNADYEALFADIRVRLRRRAYLVLLADLTERSISDSLRRGVSLVRSSHALLMTSILPAHVRPAFSRREDLNTDQDVYAALAGDRENQRLGALARQLRQLDVQLRYVPAEKFLRTAVEGYLENKREQRL
jgi:hypothetical protein